MSDFGRRLFLASAIVLVIPGAATARTIVPSVLFVCQAGTAKSAIARELLRRRAKERGIAVTVLSRGLSIENHVSASLKKRLDLEAIDTRRDGFKVLSASDLQNADIVVSFTTLPPSYGFSPAKDWSAVPSINDAYVLARRKWIVALSNCSTPSRPAMGQCDSPSCRQHECWPRLLEAPAINS